jgi:hypothetical protein
MNMRDFDPETMISAREAKAYAMQRRFEVPPCYRVHVCLYACESEESYPYAYREFYNDELRCFESDPLLDSFRVWDKNAKNMIGELGAYYYAFDRKAFFELFSHYQQGAQK